MTVLKGELNKIFFSLLVVLFIAFCPPKCIGQQFSNTPVSTSADALALLNKADIRQSSFWPNVTPKSFTDNIRQNILHPLDLYEGSFTNFCGYAALTYLPLHDDPVTYTKFLITLYKDGQAKYSSTSFNPSESVKKVAGTLRFKGKLDIRPADQIWFLSLADHFKSYLNFFSKNYKPGAEDQFWASVSYGKFNRMIKQLFNYKVEARGSDLFRPHIPHIADFLIENLKSGTTFVYLNNSFLLKKNENLKPGIPTHYIVLLSIIREANGSLTMTYWDYGYKSLRQLSESFLKRIIFGISHCIKKSNNEK